MVAIATTMLVLYLIVATVVCCKLGGEYILKKISVARTPSSCILQAMNFTAGIYVVLQGVRLIVGEIVPRSKASRTASCPTPSPRSTAPSSCPLPPTR